MSENGRRNLIKYSISFGLGLIYAAIHCFSRDIGAMEPVDIYRTLSDAFFVPGMFMGFAGLLVWVANEGALDGVSYVLGNAFRSLMFMGRRGKVETYKEYVERRREKKTIGYSFLFVTGAVFLVVQTVFTALYYQVYS